MTTTFDETSMMRSRTSRCAGVGSDRTVWSVVTIGMVSRESSAMMWPPASPPKMPNSCCRETTSNWPAFRNSAACDIVIDAIVVDLEADGGRIVVDVAMVGHRDDGGFRVSLARPRPPAADRS